MRVRVSVRAVLLDPDNRVLLQRYDLPWPVDPARPELRHLWATPGGGVEDGEDMVAALARELREELGQSAIEIGAEVWRGEAVIPFAPSGEILRSCEHYFLARTNQIEISTAGMTSSEQKIISTQRWWSAEELACSHEVFKPWRLVDHLAELVRDGSGALKQVALYRPESGSDARASYDTWSATYDTVENPTRDLSMQFLRRTIRIGGGDDVVEIGCGTGLNTEWLAGTARSVIALDFSDGMLARARARVAAASVQFRKCDLRQHWPVEDQVANVIVCALVLEHIADLRPVFAEAARTLKPCGRIFVAEYHPKRQELGKKANFTRAHDGQKVEIEAYVHTIADYESAIQFAGLEMIERGDVADLGAAPTEIPRLLFILARNRV